MLNVFGCSKSVSGLSMGVLNFMLKVSDERGENMPLSKLPTPPILLVKLRRGVSGRGRVFKVRGLLDELGMAIPMAEDVDAVGVCVYCMGATGLVESEVGLAVECVTGVVPRFGVTKLV